MITFHSSLSSLFMTMLQEEDNPHSEQGNGMHFNAEQEESNVTMGEKKETSITIRAVAWILILFVCIMVMGVVPAANKANGGKSSHLRDEGNAMHSSKNKTYLLRPSIKEDSVSTSSHYNATILQLRANPPPLSDFLDPSVQPAGITGDVEWLLDFAIVGFPKCGTSYLKRWLNESESIYLDDHEVNGFSNNKPNRLVQHLYQVVQEYQGQKKIKTIGIKNPTDLDTELSLEYYRRFFGSTKLVVMLRHPVLWFQSYYNFRFRKFYRQNHNETKDTRRSKTHMPPPERLIGTCKRWDYGVCTDRAQFHHAMSRLGLTPMNTTDELELLDHNWTIEPTRQKVFILDVTQMNASDDKGGAEALQRDLQDFLQVDSLPPMPQHDVSSRERFEGEIDICKEEHDELRKILVQHGQRARQWILKYLLQSDRAVVSSRQHFVEILETWKTDPCLG